MTVGQKIRARRIELGLTMEELGNMVGVQRSGINKYEKDMVDIPRKQIIKLANVLEISPLVLLDDDETEDKEILDAYYRADKVTQNHVRLLLGLK